MSRWYATGRLAAAALAAFTTAALFAASPSLAQSTVPPADFGSPPSGAIPIIFDDRHVYAKPDVLRSDRVLAALVRNGVLFVPLRSMFEQMGATVSWDEATRTADVAKPGADVKVTLGRAVVVVNGEERPLDVPPMVYGGVVVVPVRVIAEAMGAYVQWVPDRRVVVVRYLGTAVPTLPPPTPSPTPAPVATPAPTAVPTATPSPTPAPRREEAFIAGDYLFSPKVYNEISPGNTATSSYDLRGAIEFPLFGLPAMIEGDYRHYQYPHFAAQTVAPCAPGATVGCGTVVGNQAYNTGLCPSRTDQGCVTVIGFQQTIAFNGLGQAYVPALVAHENEGDVRVGFKIFDPRVYIGGGYLTKSYDYLGIPRLSGAGFGLTKLPDLDQPFSLDGSVWYYPRISGNYTFPTSPFLGPLSGSTTTLAYAYWKYRVGATIDLGRSGVFLGVGLAGERANARTNAPSDTTVNAPYAGLGVHF